MGIDHEEHSQSWELGTERDRPVAAVDAAAVEEDIAAAAAASDCKDSLGPNDQGLDK